MNKKAILILLMILPAMNALCQVHFSQEKTLFNKDLIVKYSIQTINGNHTHLPLPSKELLVIAFLSPECPICKNYSVKLLKLKNKYVNQAGFIGIIPGSFEAEDVAEFQKKYLPTWRLFRDKSLLLTHYLKGRVTPEVLVINIKSGLLIYKGAIDDWMVSLGKTRNHSSNFYLDTALNNFLNNKPAIPFTKPVGCLINDF